MYQIGNNEVQWMKILCSPNMKCIVLMVYLMHLVEKMKRVEHSMKPKEKEVLDHINYNDLDEKLRKCWKVVKSNSYSIFI